jgi:hypothetical protein
MNNGNETLLQDLKRRGWIISSSHVMKRIQQEKCSLNTCQKRTGFLAQYDTLIRYCFIWLLHRGYDIHPGKVHPVLQFMLEKAGGLSLDQAKAVVQNRHALKYQKAPITEESFDLLKGVLSILK